MMVKWCPFFISISERGLPMLARAPVIVIFIIFCFFLLGQKWITTNFVTSTNPKVSVMTKVKETSTWNSNKNVSVLHCPITYVMNKIGGHWKPIILYYLI